MGASNGSKKKNKKEKEKVNPKDSGEYEKEALSGKSPKSLNIQQMEKATFKMKNCVCKIELDNEIFGTGFFCLIPFPNKYSPLPILVTCNHVLNENNLVEGTKIKFSLNNGRIKKSITISNSRKTFTDHEKDVTFIEIKPVEDDIKDESILFIDENALKDDSKEIYKDYDAYIIHYEKGEEVKYSLGVIKYIGDDNFTINHICNTQPGSSGGPIIDLNSSYVIGVHKGSSKTLKLNLGSLLKIPIDDFYKLNKNKNNNSNNKEVKEINISRSTNKNSIFKGENNNPKPNSTSGKMSVILEDENQKDYSLICFKTDKFSSLEEKLFQKEPSLRYQKLCYIINNTKIDISKTIEENNINDGSTIYFKIDKNDTNLDNSLVNNKKKAEKKISNEKISVIITDEYQKDYSFICRKSDNFSSLEEKLFEKDPSLRNKKHYYIVNNQKIDISKTIEQNNIVDGSNIYYKIDEDNKEPEPPKISVVNKKETGKKISNEKISVIITDEYQKDYSFICRKSDIFSSLEEKLFEKDPSLRNKKHYYIVNNQKIDISKTIEENNIVDGSNIYYKSGEEENKPEPPIESIVTIDNIKKENNIINEKMSVIIEDEEQNAYSFICRKTDKFSSLEKKLFKKVPSLKSQRHYYTINNKSVYFYKTLEENNIVDGSIVYYKIDDEDYDDEFMAVIFISTDQDIKIPIACKKTDKFKVLEEKLYEKKPDLKNINHYYLCGGTQIYGDVEKTLEMLNIKDCEKIMINNIDSTTIVN